MSNMRKTLCALLGILALSGCRLDFGKPPIDDKPVLSDAGGSQNPTDGSSQRIDVDSGFASYDASSPDGAVEPIFRDAGSDAGGRDFDAGLLADAGRISFDAGIAQLPDAGVLLQPLVPDNNCLVLFCFEQPEPLRNDCYQVYGVVDHNSQRVEGGKFGEARYFDGNSYLVGPGNMTLDLLNALTVEAWIKPDLESRSFRGDYGNIFHSLYADRYSNPSAGDGWQGFALNIRADSTVLFEVGINDQHLGVSSPASLPTNRYSHLAGIYDGEKARLFLDGDLIAEEQLSGTITHIPYGNVYFSIGADRNGEGAFKGSIDEVRISNIARY